MISDIGKFEKKLIDNGINREVLAERLNISQAVLTEKLEKPEGDFKLSELLSIAQLTNMDEQEFLLIFFGEKLSLNEREAKATA